MRQAKTDILKEPMRNGGRGRRSALKSIRQKPPLYAPSLRRIKSVYRSSPCLDGRLISTRSLPLFHAPKLASQPPQKRPNPRLLQKERGLSLRSLTPRPTAHCISALPCPSVTGRLDAVFGVFTGRRASRWACGCLPRDGWPWLPWRRKISSAVNPDDFQQDADYNTMTNFDKNRVPL